MQGLRLYKKEKLCSEIAIGQLFDRDHASERQSALAYPLRAVWRTNPGRHADCPQFLVMVPKRRLRHAVDRVRMRRLIRESYRLNRHLHGDAPGRMDIAFVYVAQNLTDYQAVEKSMQRLLKKIFPDSVPAASPE